MTMEITMDPNQTYGSEPSSISIQQNLETSHCGSMLLVQIEAHFWNLALFNMQLVQHVVCIMVIPN